MPEKLALSVIVPVKNEESNLAACLSSVTWADEVWVVDSLSTDRTVEVANSYGARVTQFYFEKGQAKKKNWALDNLPLKHEWVLLLDADERVPPELAAEIGAILYSQTKLAGYYLNRKLIFLRRWIRHCGWYPSWNLRLFKHRLGRYEKLETEEVELAGDVEVHEHVVLNGRAGFLQHDLIHEDYKSIYHFIERHNRYSNWEAHVYRNLASNRELSASLKASFFGSPLERKRFFKRLWVRLPARSLLRFVWMYLLRRGFLDGKPGLIFCALMSFHEAVIGAKLYEQALRAAAEKIAAAQAE